MFSIVAKAATKPSKKPVVTCASECWRRIMRLVPTAPAMMSTRQSHHVGSKLNISEKATNAPVTPPSPAECVDIFHHLLIRAQTICMTSAAMSMELMK